MSESLRNSTIPPVHPGEILREDVLPDLGVRKGEFARRLGISRQHLYDILYEKKAVTPDMALRLAYLLDGTPEIWLSLQKSYDLWYARKKVDFSKLEPFAATAHSFA